MLSVFFIAPYLVQTRISSLVKLFYSCFLYLENLECYIHRLSPDMNSIPYQSCAVLTCINATTFLVVNQYISCLERFNVNND